MFKIVSAGHAIRKTVGAKNASPGTRAVRKASPRGRIVLVGLFMLLSLAVFFTLTQIYKAFVPAEEPVKNPAADEIVAVGRGTLVAPSGTPGREIADWLETHPNGTRNFEVGGHQFLGDTAQLTPESIERLSRLAVMLKAARDAKVSIIGYSAPEATERASSELSQQRAANVRAELIRFGIAPERIHAEGRGTVDPIAPNDNQAGHDRNARVAILLSRDSSP
jgi:outer membrane protein OmpA-like peptidoglycan-associated protein